MLVRYHTFWGVIRPSSLYYSTCFIEWLGPNHSKAHRKRWFYSCCALCILAIIEMIISIHNYTYVITRHCFKLLPIIIYSFWSLLLKKLAYWYIFIIQFGVHISFTREMWFLYSLFPWKTPQWFALQLEKYTNGPTLKATLILRFKQNPSFYIQKRAY